MFSRLQYVKHATLDDVFDRRSFVVEDATTVGATTVFSFGFEISTPVGAGGTAELLADGGRLTRDEGFCILGGGCFVWRRVQDR